jgi:serine/threonine-protein kinase
MVIVDCPSIECLERLFTDELEQDERQPIESHAEDCLSCQETLLELAERSKSSSFTRHFHSLARGGEIIPYGGEQAFLHQLTKRVLAAGSQADESAEVGSARTSSGPSVPGYEVLEELGRGAAGVVYRAYHRKLNRLVALKVIASGPSKSVESKQRFRMEALAIARLQHQNIVQVYDAGEDDNCLYLALELVDGDTLSAWLNGVPRPAIEAAWIVETLARAVDYAHQQGIVHRDLKPANVLIGGWKRDPNEPSRGSANQFQPAIHRIKIADFGLAKVLPGPETVADSVTQAGMILGTPAYISPEQARGETTEVGALADIYSLGAMLYELLSGRPPFQGATSMETLLQVAHHEPVPVVRLVPRTPADLNTISLKCLEKDPAKRYATAGDLAAELSRFLKGETILARPVGTLERCWRWIRRSPAQAALLAAFLAVCVSIIVGTALFHREQAAKEQQVERDLHEVITLQQLADWPAANASLEKAKVRLGNGGPPALLNQIERLEGVRRDHELISRLEAIRLDRATVVEGPFTNDQADKNYEATFRDNGIGQITEDTSVIAKRVANSPSRAAILAAVDDWAICSSDPKLQGWLMDVARQADPDIWRDQVRDPKVWQDRKLLQKLAQTAPVAEQSVQLLVALGERLVSTGGNATQYLERVQEAHPDDFWANYVLGTALKKKNPAAAIGYCRAALAIRPSAVAVYCSLGDALRYAGRMDESIAQFRRAVQINPRYAWGYISLGGTLLLINEVDQSIDNYQKGLRIEPNNAWGHYVFGNALQCKGCLNDAIDHYRKAIELNPKLAQAYDDLGRAMDSLGQHDAAIAQFQDALRRNPRFSKAHYNYGMALVHLEQPRDAIEHFQQAAQISPDLARVHAALGNCLLVEGRYEEAGAAFQQYVDLLPKDAGDLKFYREQIRFCRDLPSLEPRLNSVVKGDEIPANAVELLDFAEACSIKKNYVAAAKLYAAAYEKSPELFDDMEMRYRLMAAGAAARASGVIGEEINDQQRQALRQQAYDWLSDELSAWSLCLDSARKDRFQVLLRLMLWKVAPEFKNLRPSQATIGMPEAFRRDCEDLWENLDAVCESAQRINGN